MYSHAVSLGHGADMEGGGDGTSSRGLLLVICETLACKVGGATLRNLQDDGRLQVTTQSFSVPSEPDLAV